MGAWQILQSLLAVVGTAAFVGLAIACVWPVDRTDRPPEHPPTEVRGRMHPIAWPEAWTCEQPSKRLTVTESHRAMQLHRDHDCSRKHAAFDTLVSAGQVRPDSARHQRFWKDAHDAD